MAWDETRDPSKVWERRQQSRVAWERDLPDKSGDESKLTMSSQLENVNPEVFQRTKERDVLPEEEDDSVRDEIDAREVFGETPKFVVDLHVCSHKQTNINILCCCLFRPYSLHQ